MDAEGAAGVCFDYRLETLGGSEVGECGRGWGRWGGVDGGGVPWEEKLGQGRVRGIQRWQRKRGIIGLKKYCKNKSGRKVLGRRPISL